MQRQIFTLVGGTVLACGIAGAAVAQDTTSPSARDDLQRIHGPRSIDKELDHLTKDLELTPQQQKQVKPLLEEHHNKIQALLDRNPASTRQDLAPQIHAVSDETHREIHALLTTHQQQLEKQMLQRGHNGE